MFKPDSFIDLGAKFMAGTRRHHPFNDVRRTIPEQWNDFNATVRPQIPGASTFYGIICGHTDRSMEYMCAAEVPSFENLPSGLGKLKLQPQHYAVFKHQGHVSTIRETWDKIMQEWLPSCAYKSAERPDFELYTDKFDQKTGVGGIEIWIAVTPKGAPGA